MTEGAAPYRVAHVVTSARAAGDDRLAVVALESGLVIALADGAGGGGAAAADEVIAAVERAARGPFDPVALLRELDARLRRSGGQTTAVVLLVSEAGISGASVGDSEAWVVDADSDVALTGHQQRKPLVGSGSATPVPLGAPPLAGTLLVASDGLFKYAPRARLLELVRSSGVETLPGALVQLVRLPSGGLQDDVAVVVCRPA